MPSITRLANSNDSARIVAAAGFMLKHENMNAMPSTTLALSVMNTWDRRYSLKPWSALSTLNTAPGTKTNMPFHGNHILAKPSAVPPSTSTSAAEKIPPAIHLANSNRNREMGRSEEHTSELQS